MSSEIEKYIEEMIKDGYIRENGSPIKCKCQSNDFERNVLGYDEDGVPTFEMKCKSCKKRVGYWSGDWKVLKYNIYMYQMY